MPTFTTIALENLLEYRNSGKNSSTLNNYQPSTNKPNENDQVSEEQKRVITNKRLNHVYISPALYTTPEPTPILDYSSSGSLSSSPYVFNRKGRRGGKSADRRIDGFEVEGIGNEEELVETSLFGIEQNEKGIVIQDEGECADDDFLDPRCDSFSVASSCELNDSGRLGIANMSVISNQIGEFYDATEVLASRFNSELRFIFWKDFSSDGSIASCSRNIESELYATRLSLLEEIERRKTAENNLSMMCNQWQRMGKLLLFHTGFEFLAPSDEFDIGSMEQFSQQVIIARFVAESMGKAEARAEAEVAAEVIIGSKDKDISRMRDRLQYYEAMIHEMSQKNVESIEVARRQRDQKKARRKWLWSCIGISIVIGASVIAYTNAPPEAETEAA